MQYVITYDISDDKRRDRLAETLKNYGRRVEYSVFVANLDEELVGEMKDKVEKLLRPEDRVHVFALCASCQDKTVTFGAAEVPEDSDFYIL